jgi:hypothetical protein
VEELASLVLDLAEGIQEVRGVDASQLATLREAVESSATETGGRHRVTPNVELQDLMIPANSRLVTDVFLAAPPCLVRVQKFGWKAMPLSPFGVHLQKNALAAKAMRVEASARAWHAGIGGATVLTAAGVVTHLLLDLGFVLWQQQFLQWQRDGKAWTSEGKVVGAIGYFMKGLHVGETPVFDGICAYCGSLLYDRLNDTGSVSNKTNGPPVTIDGEQVKDRSPVDAQPPFLLRWSPDCFTRMVPNVFSYNAKTNRVGLHGAHLERPPWYAVKHHRQKDSRASWLYCGTCQDRLFAKAKAPHVPFRDKRSQSRMEGYTATELETEEALAAAAVPKALLKEWESERERLARSTRGARGPGNLVPHPQPEYWQNAPEAPFHELKSEASRGHLAC